MYLINNSIFIGYGGAGVRILDNLIKNNSDLNYAMVVSSLSEQRTAENNKDYLIKTIDLDYDGTGSKPSMAYEKAYKYRSEYRNIVKDYKYIFHLFSTAGGTGSGTAINFTESINNKSNIFLGVLPSYHPRANQIVYYKNAFDNISKINKQNLGSLWLFDNSYSEDLIGFFNVNESIGDEIYSFFNLIEQITDKNDNILSILEKQGIITLKKVKFKNLSYNLTFEKLLKRDKSVSYNYNLENFDEALLALEISKEQDLKEAEIFIANLKDKLYEETGIKISNNKIKIYRNSKEFNEIKLIFISTNIRKESYKKFKDKYVELQKRRQKRLKELKKKSFSFTSKKVNYDLINDSDNNEETLEDLLS